MKKKIVSVVLLLTMSVTFAACGNKEKNEPAAKKEADISVVEVLSNMSEASQDVEGANATVSINFDASIKEGEDSSKIAVKGDMDVKSTADPVASYVNLDMSVKAADESQDVKQEAYVVEENEGYKVYFGNDDDGWMSMEMSADDLGIDMDSLTASNEDLTEYFTEENADKYFENVKVVETKVDGKECYSVTGDVSGELMDTAIEYIESMADTSVGDIPDIKISLEICTDKKTNLPVAMNISADVAKNDTIEISACEIGIKYNGYESEEITVPEEALNATDISDALY